MKTEFEKAVSYAIQTRAAGIMEKDGSYLTAKDWNEIEYAKSNGWRYVGHPVDLVQMKG